MKNAGPAAAREAFNKALNSCTDSDSRLTTLRVWVESARAAHAALGYTLDTKAAEENINEQARLFKLALNEFPEEACDSRVSCFRTFEGLTQGSGQPVTDACPRSHSPTRDRRRTRFDLVGVLAGRFRTPWPPFPAAWPARLPLSHHRRLNKQACPRPAVGTEGVSSQKLPPFHMRARVPASP